MQIRKQIVIEFLQAENRSLKERLRGKRIRFTDASPERSRHTPWSTFLTAHWKVLAASDFLTVEVRTRRGLVTHYLLFVISLADRVVNIAGITTRPEKSWMLQIARNETDPAGALHSKRYLIIDRDTKSRSNSVG